MSHRPQESNLKGGSILASKIESATPADVAAYGMAKDIAGVLDKHYPGHMWAVGVDPKGGTATVKNLRLSGTWGFLLKLPAIYSVSEFEREIMLAGGELLERYKLHTGRFNQAQYDGLQRQGGQHIASM